MLSFRGSFFLKIITVLIQKKAHKSNFCMKCGACMKYKTHFSNFIQK